MLHEEVNLKYDDLQSIIQDYQLLEKIREFLPIGVSIKNENKNFFFF